jgi:glutathione synthase
VIDFIELMVNSKQQLSPRKQSFRELLSDAEALI